MASKSNNKDPFTYQKERDTFLSDLKQFHASRGTQFVRLPTIGGRDVDLYSLYTKVTALGGWAKVNDDFIWEDLLEDFSIPFACTNGGQALRQIYVRYLYVFECCQRGDDPAERDDGNIPAHQKRKAGPMGGVPCTYNHRQHQIPVHMRESLGLSADIVEYTEYNKLHKALLSGLPNEVDFAINVCTLLSNEGRHKLILPHCPHLVDLFMAHVGIFAEGDGSLMGLAEESWRTHTGRNFIRFWLDSVNDKEIHALVAPLSLYIDKDEVKTTDMKEIEDEQALQDVLSLDRSLGVHDVEGQRILQMAMIIRNLSFEEENILLLAKSLLVFRFLLLCVHSKYNSLKQLALDTLGNITNKMKLDPIDYRTTQLVLRTVTRTISSQDRYEVVRGLEVLSRLCTVTGNAEIISEALEAKVYQDIVSYLTVQDIQLIVFTLEALYQLSKLGDVTANHIARIQATVDVLVSLVTVEAQSYGPNSLMGIKVVEHVPAGQAPMNAAAAGHPSQLPPNHPHHPAAMSTPHHNRGSMTPRHHPQMGPPRSTPPPQAIPPHLQHRPSPQSIASSQGTPMRALPPAQMMPTSMPQSEMDVEQNLACAWLSANFEYGGHVFPRAELYNEFLATCGRTGIRSIVNNNGFARCVRMAFPKVDSVRVDDAKPDIHFKGLRRRQPPMPFPPPQRDCGTPPPQRHPRSPKHPQPGSVLQQQLNSPPQTPTGKGMPASPLSPSQYPTIQQALLVKAQRRKLMEAVNEDISRNPPDSNLIKSLLAKKVTANLSNSMGPEGLPGLPAQGHVELPGEGPSSPRLPTQPWPSQQQPQPAVADAPVAATQSVPQSVPGQAPQPLLAQQACMSIDRPSSCPGASSPRPAQTNLSPDGKLSHSKGIPGINLEVCSEAERAGDVVPAGEPAARIERVQNQGGSAAIETVTNPGLDALQNHLIDTDKSLPPAITPTLTTSTESPNTTSTPSSAACTPATADSHIVSKGVTDTHNSPNSTCEAGSVSRPPSIDTPESHVSSIPVDDKDSGIESMDSMVCSDKPLKHNGGLPNGPLCFPKEKNGDIKEKPMMNGDSASSDYDLFESKKLLNDKVHDHVKPLTLKEIEEKKNEVAMLFDKIKDPTSMNGIVKHVGNGDISKPTLDIMPVKENHVGFPAKGASGLAEKLEHIQENGLDIPEIKTEDEVTSAVEHIPGFEGDGDSSNSNGLPAGAVLQAPAPSVGPVVAEPDSLTEATPDQVKEEESPLAESMEVEQGAQVVEQAQLVSSEDAGALEAGVGQTDSGSSAVEEDDVAEDDEDLEASMEVDADAEDPLQLAFKKAVLLDLEDDEDDGVVCDSTADAVNPIITSTTDAATAPAVLAPTDALGVSTTSVPASQAEGASQQVVMVSPADQARSSSLSIVDLLRGQQGQVAAVVAGEAKRPETPEANIPSAAQLQAQMQNASMLQQQQPQQRAPEPLAQQATAAPTHLTARLNAPPAYRFVVANQAGVPQQAQPQATVIQMSAPGAVPQIQAAAPASASNTINVIVPPAPAAATPSGHVAIQPTPTSTPGYVAIRPAPASHQQQIPILPAASQNSQLTPQTQQVILQAAQQGLLGQPGQPKHIIIKTNQSGQIQLQAGQKLPLQFGQSAQQIKVTVSQSGHLPQTHANVAVTSAVPGQQPTDSASKRPSTNLVEEPSSKKLRTDVPPRLPSSQGQPQPTSTISSAARPPDLMCEWSGCRRCFETARQVANHVLKVHIDRSAPNGVCRWDGCDGLTRQKWSLVTHIQDRHVAEQLLRAATLRRKQLEAAGQPPALAPVVPIPPPVYPTDAAVQAIRRYSIRPPYPEFMELKEGPVTKHIRLTSALILRNLAKYSTIGRRLLRKHEEHLAYIALSNVESSTAVSSCLWELNSHLH